MWILDESNDTFIRLCFRQVLLVSFMARKWKMAIRWLIAPISSLPIRMSCSKNHCLCRTKSNTLEVWILVNQSLSMPNSTGSFQMQRKGLSCFRLELRLIFKNAMKRNCEAIFRLLWNSYRSKYANASSKLSNDFPILCSFGSMKNSRMMQSCSTVARMCIHSNGFHNGTYWVGCL